MRRFGRVLRRIGLGGAALAVLLLAALAGTQLFVGSERGRGWLTHRVSEALGQQLSVEDLELHLLSGLRLEGLRLVDEQGFPEAPLVELDRLHLGYSLQSLLGGSVRVDDLTVEGLRVNVVFREGRSNLPGGDGDAPESLAVNEPPAEPRTLSIPSLPVGIELGEVVISDLDVQVDMDGETRLSMRDLDLSLHGRVQDGSGRIVLDLHAREQDGSGLHLLQAGAAAEPVEVRGAVALTAEARLKEGREAWLTADLVLPDATVDLGEGARSAVLGVRLEAALLPEEEQGTVLVKHLDLDLGPAGALEASGRMRDPLGTTPRVDAYVHRGSLSLAELTSLAAPFLPELSAAGRVSFDELKAEGTLDGGSRERPFVVAGVIDLHQVEAQLPDFDFGLTGLEGSVDLELVKLVSFFPVVVRAGGALNLEKATLAEGGRIDDATLELVSATDTPYRQRLRAELSTKVKPPGVDGVAPLPLEVVLEALADTREESIEELEVTLRLAGALDASLTGTVEAYGQGPIDLAAAGEAHLAPLLALVPDALLGELERPELAGALRFDAQITGDLAAQTLDIATTVRPVKLSASKLPSDASVASLGGKIQLHGKLLEGFSPGPFRAEGSIDLADLTVRGEEVTVGHADLSFNASGETLPPTRLRAELALGASNIVLQGATELRDATLSADLRGDPLAGDLDIPSLNLTLEGDRAVVQASASVEDFGQEALEATVHVEKLDPTRLLAIARALPGGEQLEGLVVEGRPTLHGEARGRLPSPEDLEALSLPLVAKLVVHLPDTELRWPERELEGGRVSGDLSMDLWPERIDLAADLGAFELRHGLALDGAPMDLALNVEAKLLDLDRLVFPRVQLSLLNQGAFAFTKGEISGFGKLLRTGDDITPAALLEQVAAEVETVMGLSAPEGFQVGEIDLEGSTSARLTSRMRPGRELALDGEFFFRDLGVRVGEDLVLTQLDGRFPIAKTLAIGDAPALHTGQSTTRPFYEALRPLSPSRDNLTVARIQNGDREIHDLYLDLAFAERSLRLDRFGFGVFGGWVAGHLETAFLPTKDRISISTEFGEVSLKGLLPGDADLSESEAQVAGNIRMDLDLARSTTGRAPGLEELNADLNLTRIGDQALNELLRSLDPKGENSSISTFRTILQTTDLKIDDVQIPIRNGYLTVIVDYSVNAHLPKFVARFLDLFYEDLTRSRFEIPNISLFNLSNSQQFTGMIEKLAALEPALDVVGGERIIADPDGGVRFR